MWQLAAVFGDIALRRRGPESLPDSSFLIGLLLAVYLGVVIVDLGAFDALSGAQFAAETVRVVLMFAFVFAILRFFRLERRYRQTMSAVLGANVAIYAAFLPFAVVGLIGNIDLLSAPFIWVRIGVYLWAVVIEASIFARALSQPLVLGFMFEFLYVLASLGVSDFFTDTSE